MSSSSVTVEKKEDAKKIEDKNEGNCVICFFNSAIFTNKRKWSSWKKLSGTGTLKEHGWPISEQIIMKWSKDTNTNCARTTSSKLESAVIPAFGKMRSPHRRCMSQRRRSNPLSHKTLL